MLTRSGSMILFSEGLQGSDDLYKWRTTLMVKHYRHKVRKDRTFGTIMSTIDQESIQHSIFKSGVKRLIFLSVCSAIFNFHMASSNSVEFLQGGSLEL